MIDDIQLDKINQVAVSMEIAGMPLTDEAYKNLYRIASKQKSAQEVIDDLKREYTHTKIV